MAQQLVYSGWMNAKIFRKLLYRHQFRQSGSLFCHFSPSAGGLDPLRSRFIDFLPITTASLFVRPDHFEGFRPYPSNQPSRLGHSRDGQFKSAKCWGRTPINVGAPILASHRAFGSTPERISLLSFPEPSFFDVFGDAQASFYIPVMSLVVMCSVTLLTR